MPGCLKKFEAGRGGGWTVLDRINYFWFKIKHIMVFFQQGRYLSPKWQNVFCQWFSSIYLDCELRWRMHMTNQWEKWVSANMCLKEYTEEGILLNNPVSYVFRTNIIGVLLDLLSVRPTKKGCENWVWYEVQWLLSSTF